MEPNKITEAYKELRRELGEVKSWINISAGLCSYMTTPPAGNITVSIHLDPYGQVALNGNLTDLPVLVADAKEWIKKLVVRHALAAPEELPVIDAPVVEVAPEEIPF